MRRTNAQLLNELKKQLKNNEALDKLIEDKNEALKKQRREIAQKQHVIEALERNVIQGNSLDEKNEALKNLRREIAQKGHTIEALERSVNNQVELTVKVREALRDRDARIVELNELVAYGGLLLLKESQRNGGKL